MIEEDIAQLAKKSIQWEASQQDRKFSTVQNGQTIFLRLNNFPDEPPCTVSIGEVSKDLAEFPDKWSLPGW